MRGEASVHRDDVRVQLHETLENLRALVVTALGAPVIARELRQVMPNVRDLELAPADICRAELRVEIEGLADMKLG